MNRSPRDPRKEPANGDFMETAGIEPAQRSPRRKRKDNRKHGDCGCERCAYCSRPLTGRHEHDHFPIPARLGGTEWVPSCLHCHDLKDRISFHKWPMAAISDFMVELQKAPPTVRLMLTKLMTEIVELRAEPDEDVFVEEAA